MKPVATIPQQENILKLWAKTTPSERIEIFDFAEFLIARRQRLQTEVSSDEISPEEMMQLAQAGRAFD
ncbi:MAG: hypothetical protein B6244_01805 [Candidatus Cloacimonetes bacterium 4572_55]|nr:MAG: hypothetical protein B6244_01805 [Candidatus Cloacimonetes bacterium 4572_55]